MSTHAVNNLSPNYLQSLVNNTIQNAGGSNNAAALSALAPQQDSGALSPFAQLLSTLQQLQQSDPAKYKQVTAQIATNLAAASQIATAEGNTGAATQLNQLVTDFTNASNTGQLPNIQDLAQATQQGQVQGGGGHHGHHHHGGGYDATTTSTTTTSTTTPNQTLSQLLSAYQSNGSTQNDSLNPLSIISKTLETALRG